MKKKKWMMMTVMVLALTMMFGTTVYASGKGDVAGAIEYMAGCLRTDQDSSQ